jgi:hypothetical protein
MWTIEADGVSKHFPNGLAFYAAKDGKKASISFTSPSQAGLYIKKKVTDDEYIKVYDDFMVRKGLTA